MPLPNFLVIGAGKAGSTAIYHHLRQHPDVFMPDVKEPNFWALEGHAHDWQGPERGMNACIDNMEEYLALFEGAGRCRAIGEATPYLTSGTAPGRIREHIPGARLLAILRHPAERAFSAYSHLVRDGFEPHSFERGLAEEAARIRAKWSPLFWYRQNGLYGRDIKLWLEHFPAEQLRIYLYDDFKAEPMKVVRDAFSFIGVDPEFRPKLERLNVSGVPRSRLLYDLLRKDNHLKSVLRPLFPKSVRDRIQAGNRKFNIGPKPTLNPETRRELTESFREDILLLQRLIGRDLSRWLGDAPARAGSSIGDADGGGARDRV